MEKNWKGSRDRLKNQRKASVEKAIEECNKQKSISSSTTTAPQGIKVNTIIQHFNDRCIQRKPQEEIIGRNK